MEPKKRPVIRQTKASMYRIAKANPLLFKDPSYRQTAESLGLSQDAKIPQSVYWPGYNLESSRHGEALDRTAGNVSFAKPAAFKKPLKSSSSVESLGTKKVVRCSSVAEIRLPKKVMIRSTSVESGVVKNKEIKPSTSSVDVCMRPKKGGDEDRSFLKRRKVVMAKPPLRKSMSADSIKPPSTSKLSPVREKSVTFRTPVNTNSAASAAKRCVSTPAPSLSVLQKRLNDWLSKHKKPAASYQSLRRLSLQHEDQEEDKENSEPVVKRSDPEPEVGCSVQKKEEMAIAREALEDLHKLIMEGHPCEYCEAWLGQIRQRCDYLEEEPQYWECRAAIEQSRGNISSAVGHYKNAIIQGAEESAIEKSLEHMFEKFKLLDIEHSSVAETQSPNNRTRILTDARNAFKSSVIQFAVQQRAQKCKQKASNDDGTRKKYLVTPVRRSTRQSRKSFISTPGVQIVSSLHDLDAPVASDMMFVKNDAL